MLHGTDYSADEFDLDELNPSSGSFDVCTTDDEDVAEMYATRFMGEFATIIEFDVARDARIADEQETLKALGYSDDEIIGMTPAQKFTAVDTSLDQLRAAGFDAVQYTDQLPGSPEKFTTTRFIQPVIEICDAWDVE